MENIIGNNVKTKVLIIHHIKDSCLVAKYLFEKSFSNILMRQKNICTLNGGGQSSGRPCVPLNHHGFEGIENKVKKISPRRSKIIVSNEMKSEVLRVGGEKITNIYKGHTIINLFIYYQ